MKSKSASIGLLVSRPAIRLGDVSYGIYLLQGLVLAAVFRSSFVRGVTSSPVLNWSLTLIAGILLIAVATAGHVIVERPGIALGKYVSSTIQARRKERMVAVKG
jgi:peptidoglycan/LPS O-acetylase OafA/YrhL